MNHGSHFLLKQIPIRPSRVSELNNSDTQEVALHQAIRDVDCKDQFLDYADNASQDEIRFRFSPKKPSQTPLNYLLAVALQSTVGKNVRGGPTWSERD